MAGSRVLGLCAMPDVLHAKLLPPLCFTKALQPCVCIVVVKAPVFTAGKLELDGAQSLGASCPSPAASLP